MTGYGRAVADAQGLSVHVEIRTVNHRYLDVRIRMPAGLLSLEDDVRRRLSRRLARGRVECTVSLDYTEPPARAVRLDEPLLQSVAASLRRMQEVLGDVQPVRIGDVVGIADLWKIEAEPVDERAALEALTAALEEALDAVVGMRQAEGAALVQDLLPRIQRVEEFVDAVADRGPQLVQDAQKRLQERLQQLLGDRALDPDRLAQEVALLADRADVSEELARIQSHLRQMRSELDSGGAVGRTLDFLLQELHREWNTIGAKMHDADATAVVIQARSEIEKMREQVQNIQ